MEWSGVKFGKAECCERCLHACLGEERVLVAKGGARAREGERERERRRYRSNTYLPAFQNPPRNYFGLCHDVVVVDASRKLID